MAVNGVFSYLAGDGLGSANVTLNASGAAIASLLYAPYGGTRYSSGTMPTDYGFTGQHSDSLSGLDYFGARYYDPLAGQFASADTILPGGGFDVWGLSRFAYVEGNPIIRSDPSGLCSPFPTCLSAIADNQAGPSVRVSRIQSVNQRIDASETPVMDPSFLCRNSLVCSADVARTKNQPCPGFVSCSAAYHFDDVLDRMYLGYLELGKSAQDAWLLISVISIAGIGTDIRGGAGEEEEPSRSGGRITPEEDAAAEGAAPLLEEGGAAAINGETAATAAGRAAHAGMDYGEGFQKEFALPSGARVDAVNFEDRIVLELMPNNMRAIYRGLNQVDRYLEELNREFPGETPWQGQVVTYGG